MTEILTESFCERCGTRYTFESAKPRVRLKGVKVLSRGLKNFVLSDDTSIDEAMAAARSETDRETSSHQLDAFHKTFNFCMSCRQYTCPNCWNDVEARCLTCAPLALAEAPQLDGLQAFRDAALTGDATLIGEATQTNGLPEHVHAFELPATTIEAEATAFVEAAAPEAPAPLELVGNEALDEAEIAATWAPAVEDELIGEAPVATDEAVAEDWLVPEESTTAQEPAAAANATAPADPAGKAAAQTTGLLQRFRPGQSLDDELAAFERERGDVVAASEDAEPFAPDLEAADEPVEEPVSAVGEPVIAEAAAAAEELVAEAPVAIPEPEPDPIAAAGATDVVQQPTWRITAPDATGTTTPRPPIGGDAGVPLQASGGPTATPDGAPQWPARPQWPGAAPAGGLPFLGRPAAPEGGIEALWAASNQELVTAAPSPQGKVAAGIQPCISCGLSLSANARFCRRCGTLQGR